MPKVKVYFYPSEQEEKNAEVLDDLRKLEKLFKVFVVPSGQILEGYCELPFLRTEEGKRIWGIEGIHRFASENSKP